MLGSFSLRAYMVWRLLSAKLLLEEFTGLFQSGVLCNNIWNMKDHVRPHFQTLRRELKILCAVEVFFVELCRVWMCGQTMAWVIDVSSQWELKLSRKWRKTIVKIDAKERRAPPLSLHTAESTYISLSKTSSACYALWPAVLSSVHVYVKFLTLFMFPMLF